MVPVKLRTPDAVVVPQWLTVDVREERREELNVVLRLLLLYSGGAEGEGKRKDSAEAQEDEGAQKAHGSREMDRWISDLVMISSITFYLTLVPALVGWSPARTRSTATC